MLDDAVADRRGPFVAIRHHCVDCLIGDLVKKAGFPITLEAGRIEAVDQLLGGSIGYGGNLIQDRRPSRSEASHDFFSLGDRSVVADVHAHDGSTVGQSDENDVKGQLFGSSSGDLAKKLENRFRFLNRVSHYASQHRTNRMELILEGGDDTEVAAAAAQAPEQIRILDGAGRKEPAVGRDNIDREKIVAAQAMLASQIAPSAP